MTLCGHAAYAPVPRWQLGYVSPLPVVDALHYEFYRVLPADAVFIACPLAVGEFAPRSVDAALAKLSAAIDYLRRREADRIVLGGMPVSALAGRQRMLDIIGEMGKIADVPVTSDVEDIVTRLRASDISTVVLAAKWKADVLAAAEGYFRAAGFDVLGSVGSDFDARDVGEVVTTRSADLAVALGETALRRFAGAEALVLGGGTWLSITASERIEHESRKPVISNTTAMLVEACLQFGLATDALSHLLMSRRPAEARAR